MASLAAMNWLDYIIIALILISTIISLIRGFVREAMSLISWVVAIWVGLSYYQQLASSMPAFITDQTARAAVAFGLLFLGVLLLGALAGYLVSHLVDKTRLTLMNRALGIAFGVGRGILLVSLIILIGTATPAPDYHAWKDSVLIPDFKPVTSWIQSFLPDYINQHLPSNVKKNGDESE